MHKIVKQISFRAGAYYKVIGFTLKRQQIRQRMLTIGFVPGVVFKVLRVAPLGDPIEVLLKNCKIVLRKQEIQTINFVCVEQS